MWGGLFVWELRVTSAKCVYIIPKKRILGFQHRNYTTKTCTCDFRKQNTSLSKHVLYFLGLTKQEQTNNAKTLKMSTQIDTILIRIL